MFRTPRARWIAGGFLVAALAALLGSPSERHVHATGAVGSQQGAELRLELRAALEEIFDAFVRQDEAAIRAAHTDDWKGFGTASQTIGRGLADYMAQVNLVNPILDYEILDLEVDGYGDVAVVYYIAEWRQRIASAGVTVRIRARAVDIYRNVEGSWIQAGSNINVLPVAGYASMPACRQCFQVSLEPPGE